MASTSAVAKYDMYVFNPVPQIGLRLNSSPLGSSKQGPADREVVVTLVGRIVGSSFNDIQTKLYAIMAAFAVQDKMFYWNDGTTTRVNQAAKVLSIDIPTEWGTYEQSYTITLSYIPLDDTNTPPFVVSYGSYVFSPIPIFGRQLKVNRPSAYGAIQSRDWTLSLSGFIDKGSISANMTEYNALIAALAVDDTFVYGPLTQSVRINEQSVEQDTWTRKISYSLTMSFTDGLTTANVIAMTSSRVISRVTDRVARHFIPFMDYEEIQILGLRGQTVTAVGSVTATSIAAARTAAYNEIEAMLPVPGSGISALDEESSKITENPQEMKVDWNVTRHYTQPVLSGGLYGG